MSDERTDDDLQLPEERVEDLEPTGEDSDDVQGGAVKGNFKYSDITLKRGTTTE